MNVNRRSFLKLSGAGIGAALALNAASTRTATALPREFPLKKKVQETTTVCCYCSVGCGAIISRYEDGTIKVEGDPDHPINRGSLCPKGQSIAQLHQVDGKPNPNRLSKPLYRAPNSSVWQEKPLDWMISTIAERIKATRDKTWNPSFGRTTALASLGGKDLDNEECYLLSKMDRALGIVYLEHCARL